VPSVVAQVRGLRQRSAAQWQYLRAVSTRRVEQVRGDTGPVVLSQIRDVIGLILDIPTHALADHADLGRERPPRNIQAESRPAVAAETKTDSTSMIRNAGPT
jgi:hypothetical protein